MSSTFTLRYIVDGIILALLVYSVYHAFTNEPAKATVIDCIRTLRRNIVAAFIFGIGLTLSSQSGTQSFADWLHGGPLLASISSILYGYVRKAEKAALTEENQK